MTKWHYKTADEPDWMPKRRWLDAKGRPELWVNPALFGVGAHPRHTKRTDSRSRRSTPVKGIDQGQKPDQSGQ